MIQRIFYIGSQDFINSPIRKTIGDYKPNYLQIIGPYFEGSKIIVIPITNQDDKTFYSLGYRTCLKQTQKSDIHMSREDKSNVVLGMGLKTRSAQPFSQTEESIVANRNKRLPSETEKSVYTGNTVNRKDTNKLISEQSIENDEFNLNLEANALHRAVQWQMKNGRPPSLQDLDEFLSNEEIDMIFDDLDYLYGKGWDRPTATVYEMQLVEVA